MTAHALRLTLSPDLFARKFDLEEDAGIFDLIEAHLTTPAAMDNVGDIAIKPTRPRAKTHRSPDPRLKKPPG